MTRHLPTPPLTHQIALKGRKAILRGLAFALLATGVSSGLPLADRPAAALDRASNVALVSAQETLLGSYANGQASITVTKSVSGSGTTMVGAYIADSNFVASLP